MLVQRNSRHPSALGIFIPFNISVDEEVSSQLGPFAFFGKRKKKKQR